MSAQVVSLADSTALVDLYNNTNGPNWIHHTNWLTIAPLSTWYGIETQNGRIISLQLQQNNLTGTLPSSLGNLTALSGMSLAFNKLSGNIPSSIGNLSSLFVLDLSNNLFTGSIPASFTNLPAYQINLSYNYLTGIVPPMTAPPAPYIGIVQLNSNQFNFTSFESGYLPVSATILDQHSPQNFLSLIVAGNTLSVAAGGNVAANTYTWYNNGSVVATITGDSTYTPTGPGNYNVNVISSLVPGLTLSTPTPTNPQDSLALVDLYNSTTGNSWRNNMNWLTTAPVATWYGISTLNERVTGIAMSYNNLAGPLPASIGNLTALYQLTLNSNQINGSIPSSLENLPAIDMIYLDDNQLTGGISPALGSIPTMTELHLDSNKLTGSIPSTLGVNQNINHLTLSDNQLTGTIPAFSNTPFLGKLDLSNNQLSGSLPAIASNVLTILNLSGNQLTGAIPTSYLAQMPEISWFMANNNQLTGTIPASFCTLPGLAILALNDNQLTGPIPDSIGKLSPFITLSLQNNHLSGPIPASMSKLTYAAYTLQGNNFTFDGMQNLPSLISNIFEDYSPQANIPVTQKSNILSVSAGGVLAQDTFRIYRDGVLVTTQLGDSSYPVTQLGKYNIVATNPTAPSLILYSDTVGTTLILPDSTISMTETITAGSTTDIISGIFNLVTLTPGTSANALTALETVDSTIQTFNGAPYVERHYDITPALNPTTATATITLYYTQSDFDTYNAYVTAHSIGVPLLPTGGIDNGNVIITQYHGSFTGTSSPANYSQGSEVIHPTVTWDAIDSWWTATFPVSGFSGFFLGTGSNPLPLNLLDFTATPQGYTVNLQWQTTDEHDTKQFIVQHAPDGLSFDPIGTVAAKNTTTQNQYGFTDNHPVTGNNFYRLKMQDLDGRFTYSPVVEVSMSALPAKTVAYPNPATTGTSLFFSAATAVKYDIQISDASGHTLTQLTGTSTIGLNRIDIDLHNYAPGTYTITLTDAGHGRQNIRLLKE